jgi:hypothetical protein
MNKLYKIWTLLAVNRRKFEKKKIKKEQTLLGHKHFRTHAVLSHLYLDNKILRNVGFDAPIDISQQPRTFSSQKKLLRLKTSNIFLYFLHFHFTTTNYRFVHVMKILIMWLFFFFFRFPSFG